MSTMTDPATLILICGLPGSGKSTLARHIVEARNAVLLNADEWIEKIISDPTDRAELDRLRDPVEQLLWSLAQQLLAQGMDVVLDNGFWGRRERDQYLSRARELGVRCELHALTQPTSILRARLQTRPERLFGRIHEVTEGEIERWAEEFELPNPEETRLYDAYTLNGMSQSG